MFYGNWILTTVFSIDWAIRLVFAGRVVVRRKTAPVPVALAWVAVLLAFPIGGVILYIMLGERRIGPRRGRRIERVAAELRRREVRLWKSGVAEPDGDGRLADPIAALATAMGGMPPLAGNRLELIAHNDLMLLRLIEDIDKARWHVHILSYIWMTGGGGGRVADAVQRAAARGVECRVLVDGLGSRPFLKCDVCREMAAAGVAVEAALDVSPIRMLLARIDLRNHRKIAVIDGHTAYAGSQNITDSSYEGVRKRGIGPWVDASVRVEGPAAGALNAVFLTDWQLESERALGDAGRYLPEPTRPADGGSVVQVVPSGPGNEPQAIHQTLLTTVYAAREELHITTPYFVPDDSMKSAIIAAARRGVRVTIVVPKRSDTWITAAAGRSHFFDLLEAGVTIRRYTKGLLHAKIITVDRKVGVIGSANLDMRSFWLNFEVTLFIYDPAFTEQLRALQVEYGENAEAVTLDYWRTRPWWKTTVENAVQLIGPLL